MSTVLGRPNVIARGVTLVMTALAVVVIIAVTGGGNAYTLNLQMRNAAGLRPGSLVLLGGVSVGSVNDTYVRGNEVIAQLHLNRDQVHIGQGVRAAVIAANLLGENYVSLTPGDSGRPLPSGSTLPVPATTVPTTLDQVVNVLGGGTRARLAILLDEFGTAVAGRKSDLGTTLRQLPLSLSAATRLLDTMVQDNHTLSDLVANGNQFIARVNGQRQGLRDLIDTSAGAVKTLALGAGSLRYIVANGPLTLRHFTDFTRAAGAALHNLTPASRTLITAAPALDQLLRQVKPFTVAAVPTLNRAAAVAPTLTRLAEQATPTITRAVPTLASLDRIATLASPLSAWLGLSFPDLISILGDWSSSIQNRDGLSHIFNGDFYLNPSIVLNIADQGATPAQRRANLLDVHNTGYLRMMGLLGLANKLRAGLSAGVGAVVKKVLKPAAPKPSPASHGSASPSTPPAAGTAPVATPKPSPVLSGLGGLLSGLLGGGKHGSSSGGNRGGGVPTGASGRTGTGGSPSSTGLGSLLSYLLGK
jgi:ABC-type transporter Mla subunit MlaD